MRRWVHACFIERAASQPVSTRKLKIKKPKPGEKVRFTVITNGQRIPKCSIHTTEIWKAHGTHLQYCIESQWIPAFSSLYVCAVRNYTRYCTRDAPRGHDETNAPLLSHPESHMTTSILPASDRIACEKLPRVGDSSTAILADRGSCTMSRKAHHAEVWILSA